MPADAERPQPADPGSTLAPPEPGPPAPAGTTDTLNSNALLERPSAQPPSATRADDPTSGEQPNRIRCPHCQNPIDIADRRADEVLCPGCGSSFHLRDARHTDTTSTSRPLGKFHLLERVGVGAFGAVWKARDTELDRIVALKIPHSGLLSEGQELERFHREARAAAQLRHPNIVPVHEVLTLDGLPTIVADFIEGVPLRDFLTARRPTFREAAVLIADLADALEYAHAREVIHRDIKPANIMLERDPLRRGGVGRPLLMDFGLALRDGAEVTLTLDGHVIGTPAYMSPEQASGKSHNADRRSDVYSLGVVLYELLTGELPFRGSKMMILHQVLQEEPRPPRKVNDKVPRDLETVCLKCLEKEPGHRYATAGELSADLRRYLAGESVHARPAGRVEKAIKWARRRPAIAGLLAAVVFLTVAGVGGISWAYGSTLKALTRADTALDAAREANRRRVRGQVEQLRTAAPLAVPDLLKALEPERAEALPHLRELYEAGGEAKTRYALALLPDEPALRDELLAALLAADDPREMLLARAALEPFGTELTDGLWRQADDLDASTERRVRALAALAAFDPVNAKWQAAAPTVANKLLTANPLQAVTWVEAFRPVRGALLGPLKDVFTTAHLAERRPAAAAVLAAYSADDPKVLADVAGRTAQRALLRPLLELHRETGLALLRKELTTRFKPDDLAASRRQAGAAAALLVLGEAEGVWPLLRATPEPDVRTYLIRDLAPMGVDSRTVFQRLREEKDASVRRALILALGEYSDEQLPADARAALVPVLLQWYRDDPDAGVHGAIDWLLRHGKEGPVPRKIDWRQAAALARADQDLAGKPLADGQGWFVSPSGRTFALVRGPVDAQLGDKSIPADSDEAPRRVHIPRSFAVATRAVTVAEYEEFRKATPGVAARQQPQYAPEAECPITEVSWYEAAMYCRWLGEREGLAEEQQCFPQMAEIARSASLAQGYSNRGGISVAVTLALGSGGEFWRREGGVLRLPTNCLQRIGYRMPTEAEWEHACRAGTRMSWGHGADEAALARYAWYSQNSQNRTWSVGEKRPNELGLFDMHGNVWQWCLDEYRQRPGAVEKADSITDIKDTDSRATRGGAFLNAPSFVRSSCRLSDGPANRFGSIGLRVARTYR